MSVRSKAEELDAASAKLPTAVTEAVHDHLLVLSNFVGRDLCVWPRVRGAKNLKEPRSVFNGWWLTAYPRHDRAPPFLPAEEHHDRRLVVIQGKTLRSFPPGYPPGGQRGREKEKRRSDTSSFFDRRRANLSAN